MVEVKKKKSSFFFIQEAGNIATRPEASLNVEKFTLSFCNVSECARLSTDNRKKNRELSEGLRTKLVEK